MVAEWSAIGRGRYSGAHVSAWRRGRKTWRASSTTFTPPSCSQSEPAQRPPRTRRHIVRSYAVRRLAASGSSQFANAPSFVPPSQGEEGKALIGVEPSELPMWPPVRQIQPRTGQIEQRWSLSRDSRSAPAYPGAARIRPSTPPLHANAIPAPPRAAMPLVI